MESIRWIPIDENFEFKSRRGLYSGTILKYLSSISGIFTSAEPLEHGFWPNLEL